MKKWFPFSNKDKDSDDKFLEEYTVETCDSCGNEVKRKFKEGDYVFKNNGGTCNSCGKGYMLIASIYGEVMDKEQRKNKKGKESSSPPSSPPPPSTGPPPPAG